MYILLNFRFIEFGRGKVIPLTPDSSTDMPNELSNTGKIVVKKRIAKIERGDTQLHLSEKDEARYNNGKMVQRKKKGRLYSLGGNEPAKKPRGRLDRLRTVGTFDLGTEMSVLTEVARNLNEKLIGSDIQRDSSSTAIRRLSVIPAGSGGNRTPADARSTSSKHSLSKSSKNQSKSDLNNQTVNTTVVVKSQHSADDAKAVQIRSVQQKPRSVSTSSYLTGEQQGNEMKMLNSCQVIGGTGGKQRSRTHTTTFADSHDVKDKNIANILDSNKVQIEQIESDKKMKETVIKNAIDKDSNKIEMDEKLAEDNTKNDDDNGNVTRKCRKPVLRKSKRIVRTDSEIFEDNLIGPNEIILKNNLDIQIHKEPEHMRSTTSSCTNESRKESSDIEDICSPRDIKSTDDSSRNQSTDELDTVFSDTTDLERLEREYRELVRSNLQREYKSDGDTLDEVGKRRNDYLKWKNQSFENDFELYHESDLHETSTENQGQSHMVEFSRVCSPQSHITITSNSSGNSSTKHTDENRYASSSRASDGSRDTKKSSSIKESDTSTLTSPIKLVSNSNISSSHPIAIESSSNAGARPSKLDVSQSVPKENSITTLFEKRFGKFKKMNKLLKCKRFSTSALYDKKKTIETEEKKTATVEKNSKKTESTNRLFGSRFSPSKSSSGESKQLLYSSKLSLFNPKNALFSKKSSAMYSHSSRSNNELNVLPSTRTRFSEMSKSNSEINKYKCSPSRTSTKKSVKENKNNSTACLYKNPNQQSPLSEEFYNKTGSVRLSAMELYEKFCSEDFGGLYKHEMADIDQDRMDESCGGYKNWHEYRLNHKGLGAVKKFAQNKHARLLRQKSEPKFTFKGDVNAKGELYFPEEEDEDIYEEDGYDHEEEYYDEYDDEYEDEEGDYYEDEEELEDEGDECDEEIEDNDDDDEIEEGEEEPPIDDVDGNHKLQDNTGYNDRRQFNADIREDDEEAEYPPEMEYTHHMDMATATDSDVDEIFLMPTSEACNEAYEKCGFENKKFSMEHANLRKSTSMEQTYNYSEQRLEKINYSPEEEIKEFGSDEILTIYKICSKDDMLNMSDVIIHKPEVHGYTPEPENHRTSLEIAVNEYMKNASDDLPMELQTSPYGADCLTIERSDSMEIFSSSSGTMHSGSTLTEYAFDTVKNLRLDSCSTSKLSLSLKSEIFDDYTLTPDDPPKMVQNCVFEDFTLTPDGSFSEPTECHIESTVECSQSTSTLRPSKDLSDSDQDALAATNDDEVLLIVDKFLSNERLLETSLDNELDESVSPVPCTSKLKDQNYESKEHHESYETNENYDIIDLDDDSMKNVVSAFTTEITREFDLLFSRAKESNKSSPDMDIQEEDICTDATGDPSQLPSFNDKNDSGCDDMDIPLPKMSTRYSMQRLEPYFIADSPDRKSNNHQTLNHSTSNSEYCKVLDVQNEPSFIHKRVLSKLKSNRSQSLGNLSSKTRCFPL